MVAPASQTYVTHRRMDPWYHYVGTGLILAALVIALVQVFREPGLASVWMVIASAGLVVAFGRIRVYALRNQDRLIRLEETLRMERLDEAAFRSGGGARR